MARITINGITLDPAAQAHELAAAMLDSPDASQSNYILVQTTEPLNRAQKDELKALGATILEYVPNNTYLCSYSPADLGPIRALPYVGWVNVYLEGFKSRRNCALLPRLPERPTCWRDHESRPRCRNSPARWKWWSTRTSLPTRCATRLLPLPGWIRPICT